MAKRFIEVGGQFVAVGAILVIETGACTEGGIWVRVLTSAGAYRTDGAQAEELLLWATVQTFDVQRDAQSHMDDDVEQEEFTRLMRSGDIFQSKPFPTD